MSDYSLSFLADPPEPDEEEDEPKRFYGVVTGFVGNIVDPFQLGRVQLRIPAIDDYDPSAWARIAVPMSGIVSGVAFLPQFNDEVLVAFEHGDLNSPYIIGSLWNVLAPPPPNIPPDSPIRTSYVIRTLTGNQILMLETPPTVQIASPLAGQGITMTEGATAIVSASSVEIVVGGASIIVTPAGIQLAATNISLTAAGALSLAGQTISIAATANCTMLGETVLINPV